MVRLRKWWSDVGGFAAACLIAVFVASPLLDTVLCQDDGASAAISTSQIAANAVATFDSAIPDQDHAAPEGCVHGHCHHGGGDLAQVPRLTAAIGRVVERLPYMAQNRRDLREANRLERPPRA